MIGLRSYYQQKLLDLQDRNKILIFLKKSSIYLLLFIFFYGIGLFLPEGFDWRMYFQQVRIHPIWTPWTENILRILIPLGYESVFALSMLGIVIRAFRYNPSPYPIALATLSLPTLWVFYMGNLDGLVLFAMLIMPLGVPLLLMKPQVAAFAVLAKKNWFIASVIWALISLIIWGFWPLRMLMVMTPEWKMEWVQDITIFPWGLIIALPLLWFSRGDEDLLMAAGSMATPHLFPYHFILLMPALGRMRWYWMILTWLISWTPFLSNWFGDWAWHFGNLMSFCFWFGIYLNKPGQWAKDRDEIQKGICKIHLYLSRARLHANH